ncbi:LacI family DNA-binding transcriptional regulator [Aquibacillus koreensis]|uniref:LacI family DNA-binding transcriptional regulator n=1 Tax=Aquibacillus koreensis TaxID=279446 RepID=A0A9X4AKK7_9BACI|nr:LacI family DNA-binding transcriptional regulator [Aquibacillus koreensis]MCT2536719.1 LacI family DNA-binding transcriptional regulator [Aquibacillus koreensis]MDC3421525.1 LacI family DNA-binding transcriptional regulator [Aquibacillus koreensis]
MTVTIKDLAEKVGVSVTTISRVLNNRGYLSNHLKERVQEAIVELNYQPNEIARSLSRKKSNIIGLIIPDISHPFFSELTKYIEYYAYEHGYKVLLCNSLLNRAKEKEYIDLLKASQVDGIIMGSQTISVEDFELINLPVITIDRKISDEIPYICSDNYEGGRVATQLLIGKECKKIAHISGNLQLNLLAKKRHEAFMEQVVQHGVEYVVVETDINGFDLKDYERLVHKLFNDHPDIDGVFASSDVIAMQVVNECHRLGFQIPNQVKIVGYDGIAQGYNRNYMISTIEQPIKEMGKIAVENLIKQILAKNPPAETILPIKLLERETT